MFRAIGGAPSSRSATNPALLKNKGTASLILTLIVPDPEPTRCPAIHGPPPQILPLSQSRYIIIKWHVNMAILQMDTIWFHNALEQVGRTQADLARHLGLPPSAVSRLLRGERQLKLLEAVQIAQFLGVPQEEVSRHAGEPDTPPEPARRGRPPRQSVALPLPPAQRQDTMPIRSGARGGGNDREMFLQDGPIGRTPRPANLVGVRDAYAIYMTGDSMEPRYEQGWLLHVNPVKPPIRGRDVVVYKTDQTVLIKQFLSRNDDELVLRQFNPDEILHIPRGDVVECHRIVGVDQEG